MDFHSLPRRELQALCKKNRIPANMTNVAMADALQALNLVEGVGELQEEAATQFLATQKPEARAGADAPRKSRRASTGKLPAASVEPKEQQASPLPRARRVTAKASEIMRSVAEGEGNKIGEKGLGAYQVAPPAPAVPMVKETIPRITRKIASKKEEANEERGNHAVEATTIQTPAPRNDGRRTTTRRTVTFSSPVAEVVGNDAVEATTIKTSATRNGGRRTTTRRAVATSATVDEEVGNDAVEATTIKTSATKNGGRRTTTRRAVATSATLDEEVGNDAVNATTIKNFATRNGGRRTTTRRAVATSAPMDEEVGKYAAVATTTFAIRNGGRRTTTRRTVATSAPVDEEVGNDAAVATTTFATRNGGRRTTTRRAVVTSAPVAEKVGNDAVEVTTIKIPAARNGGRRTTTRGPVAASAPVEEAQEEQVLAPSRTVRRTRQTATPPAGDSVPASVPLRRSTRARSTVSKMSPLAPEDTSQQGKDVETVDSLDSGRKLQGLDVVQETSNPVTETCPSVIYDVNQILGKFEDDKLMKEKSKQQEQGFEVRHSCNKEDDELPFSDNKSSEEVLEENMGETNEICHTDYVKSGELVAEIKTTCQGEEESHQSAEENKVLASFDNMSSEVEEVLEVKMGDATEICNPDPVESGEKVAEIETICQGEEESHQLSEEDNVLALSDNMYSEIEEVLEEKMGETTEICNPDCDESEEKVAELETICQGEEESHQSAEEDDMLALSDSMSSEVEEVLEKKMGETTEICNPDCDESEEKLAELETICQGEEESHQSAEEDNVLALSENMSSEVEDVLEEKMGEATEICNPDCVEPGEKVAEIKTICQGEEENHQSAEEDDVFALSDNMSSGVEEVLEEKMGETTEICNPDHVESGEQVAEVEIICHGEEESHQSAKEDDVWALYNNMSSDLEEVLEEKMIETTEICDPDHIESGVQVAEIKTICQGEEECHQLSEEDDLLALSENKSSEVEEPLEEMMMGEATEICNPDLVESGEKVADIKTICQGEEENHQSAEEDNVFALFDIMFSEVEEVLEEKMGETIEICDPTHDESGEKVAEVETIRQGEEEIHQSAKEDDVLALSNNMFCEVEEVLEEKMVETTEICDPDRVESGEQVAEVETICRVEEESHQSAKEDDVLALSICRVEEESHQSAKEDDVLALSNNMSSEVEEVLEEKIVETTEICDPDRVESGEQVAEVETICQVKEENHQSAKEDDMLTLSNSMSSEVEEVLEEKMVETTEICDPDRVESREQVAEVETICQGEEENHQSAEEDDVFALSDIMSSETEEVLEEKMVETTEICNPDRVESGEQVAEVETICQGEEENHKFTEEEEDDVFSLSDNMSAEAEEVLEEKMGETTEICKPDCVESGEQVAEVETICQEEEESHQSANEDDVFALSNNMPSEVEEVLEEKMVETTEICDPGCVESGEKVAEIETICQGEEETNLSAKEDDVLALSDNVPSEDVEVLEEKMGETTEICNLYRVESGEQFAEVETIHQGEEESHQAYNSLSELEGSPILRLISSFHHLAISEVEDKQSMQDENSLVVQETKDADTVLVVGQEVEAESFSSEDFVADNQSMEDEDKSFVVQETKDADIVVGQQVEVERFSLEDFVTNEDEDKSLVVQETKDADTVVGQQVEVENFSFKDFVINVVADNQSLEDAEKSVVLQETKDGNIVLAVGQEVEIADYESTQDEDKSLELGETKDASYDPFVVQEVESCKICLEVESENLSAALAEGSGESSNSQDTNASGNGGSYEILAEEQLSIGKTQSDLEFMLDSDDIDIADDASNLQNLTESTGEISVLKSDMTKEFPESPSEKHVLCLEAEEINYRCANYSSESQDSNAANKENMTGRTVIVDENKVKGSSESDKQDIDLKHFSSRKIKPLLQEKISSDIQKTEKKRAALAQLDENCLQRAS